MWGKFVVAGTISQIRVPIVSTEAKQRITREQYLAIERATEQRSEFFDGEMFAMGGASERHNLIVLNFAAEIRSQLKTRPCRVYANDMRVRVSATGLYTYPDVTVVCGEVEFEDDQHDTLLNPTLVVEVLSPSTEKYDRGKKSEHYRKIESLREYVLVSQEEPHVEQYLRQESGAWLLVETNESLAPVQLTSIGCEVTLAEIYDKVTWPDAL
jgi:Uma2 family endonuclease